MKKLHPILLLSLLMTILYPYCTLAAYKPSPDQIIQILADGNKRFTDGISVHPHTDSARLFQAGTENQGDHALATVITCSDSRVPVERIFDTGVMDTFVVRVAGNVMDTDEAGSVEYGLAHVNTPVLVVLGHTQCGAVTAVTHAVHGTGHALERNIPPLVDNIIPAVKRAMAQNPSVHGDNIIPFAIVENVWQGVEDLFMSSPSSRNLVKSGKVKVVGAIYDVGSGMVNWLPEASVTAILRKVDANPARAMNAMAEDEGHGKSEDDHKESQGSAKHAVAKVHTEITPIPVTLADNTTMALLQTDWLKKKEAGGETRHDSDRGFSGTFWLLVSLLGCLAIAAVVGVASGVFNRMRLRAKLYSSFGSILILATLLGAGAYLNLNNVNGYGDLAASFLNLEIHAGKISGTQKNILLHGLENKAYGERQSAILHETVEELRGLIEETGQSSFLTDKERLAIEELQAEVNAYEEEFREVISAFHEIEEGKGELDEATTVLEEKLGEMLTHHEAVYAAAAAEGTDGAEISRQQIITEHLIAAEQHCMKLSRLETRFLLDKNPKSVALMAIEAGLCKGYVQALEHEIVDQKELRQLVQLDETIEEFEKMLGKMIADEAVIARDTSTMNTLLAQFNSSSAMMAESAKITAESIVHEADISLLLLISVMLVAGTLCAVLLTRAITTPILQSVSFAEAISSGDLTRILEVQQQDETGQLATALNKMCDSLNTIMNNIATGARGLRESSAELSATSTQMSANAEQTSGQSNTVAAAAEEMSVNMNSVAAATEQAATNVDIVASAAEEMSSTINEITRNTAKTSTMTSQAVEQASTASIKVNELGEAAKEISKVTETITEISEQTNLLALNATIEAARAGEAGKGFAVVANEIKELAKQTAQATLEIKNQIDEVQSSTEGTVIEIADITKVINDVNGMTSTIAAAIEEQSAATQEIATNVAQASEGIQEVTTNVAESSTVASDIASEVSGINQAATSLSESSSHVLDSSGELKKFSESLDEMVQQFKLK